MDLFVSIGRLGRSLGVHLLLASQRLDEGRINQRRGPPVLPDRAAHVLLDGVARGHRRGASAYELPSEPGNGYLKIDTTNLVRFKAAYVSGPYARRRSRATATTGRRAAAEVVPFTTSSAADRARR